MVHECVCAAPCLLVIVSLHSIPWSNGGSELLGTVERLSKQKTSTEIPYSQAWSVFVQDQERPSYPFNQPACICHATVISLVTETRNFRFKPIISFRRYSHIVEQNSCIFLQKGTKENSKPLLECWSRCCLHPTLESPGTKVISSEVSVHLPTASPAMMNSYRK